MFPLSIKRPFTSWKTTTSRDFSYKSQHAQLGVVGEKDCGPLQGQGQCHEILQGKVQHALARCEGGPRGYKSCQLPHLVGYVMPCLQKPKMFCEGKEPNSLCFLNRVMDTQHYEDLHQKHQKIAICEGLSINFLLMKSTRSFRHVLGRETR